jgi:hypothetical protein
MNLLVHVEQHDVVGVLPSQLESLSLVASAMGVTRTAFVDCTLDGVRSRNGWERFPSLDAFLYGEAERRVLVFVPEGGESVRTVTAADDTWLVFGPAMGFPRGTFDRTRGIWVHYATIPGGHLCARDAIPIALWEVGKWRAR